MQAIEEPEPKQAATTTGGASVGKGGQYRKRAEPADAEPYVEEIPDGGVEDDGGAAARLGGSMWSWIKSIASGRLGSGQAGVDAETHAAAQEKYQVR